jgi:hypothetical protein
MHGSGKERSVYNNLQPQDWPPPSQHAREHQHLRIPAVKVFCAIPLHDDTQLSEIRKNCIFISSSRVQTMGSNYVSQRQHLVGFFFLPVMHFHPGNLGNFGEFFSTKARGGSKRNLPCSKSLAIVARCPLIVSRI